MNTPALWNQHRMIAEAIGQSVADAVTTAVGAHVDLGIPESFNPEELLGHRPLPVRGIVVRFERPVRDAMVFVTALSEDVVRPLVQVAATSALAALDIPSGEDEHGSFGRFSVDASQEFATTEEALEACDALYLEATYRLDLPIGELLMVLGTGLLESASCFINGVADPHAEGTPYAAPTAEEETGLTFLDGDIAGPAAEEDLAFSGPVTARPARAELGVDSFDAMLAMQEQAERSGTAAPAASAPAAPAAPMTPTPSVASANASAASAAPLPELVDENPALRWTHLLSGVEVELSAELGRADLALGDIASLMTDSVLTLDQMVAEPVGVYVNGTRYATARLVVVDGEYGIEILEVVEQGALRPALAA